QVHVQEYAPPKTVDRTRAAARRADAMAAIREVLNLPTGNLHFKVRERQRGSSQYERNTLTGRDITVMESGLKFIVNLDDYLDTGLFLDHRPTRALVRDRVRGKRVLNLFAYTGSFSVYAAAGGARSTTSVDLSRTYLDWARRNMALNGFTGIQHEFVHADCLQWLAEAGPSYDLIVLDPPSFSNSARMEETLDVQRDHVGLIRACMARLTPDGVLVFSNNLRGFRLDEEALSEWLVRDISRQTLPLDFKRRPNIHRCWDISARP
ncbi:MAG: class I SAM-dependent methyltransferase, partial [Gammaproteobacteria bacterium]|nr:class I SAM-dependent methyltransferase [Gammaproteobacteria bacterium]